ncbi:MAG: hypothetical protein FWC68_04545 [Oscillospiraceae bacterium]|nr:hypothetical protein [Oscillospiraceae bacterium]
MAISFIAITLSLFSGYLIANEMSHTMLENQIRRDEENNNEDDAWMRPMPLMSMGERHPIGHGDISVEDLQEAYQVRLDLGTVLMFYGIGLGTILLSSIVPIIYIMRLNPKKILM